MNVSSAWMMRRPTLLPELLNAVAFTNALWASAVTLSTDIDESTQWEV